jgi:hypothetical protein
MRQFAAFCLEESPMQTTTQSIVRYIAWLGLQRTVVAASLQEYYSAEVSSSATTNNNR